MLATMYALGIEEFLSGHTRDRRLIEISVQTETLPQASRFREEAIPARQAGSGKRSGGLAPCVRATAVRLAGGSRPRASRVRVAGILLSGLGHAALITAAVHGPPWLGRHRERPAPVIAVSLVTEAELAALARPAPPAPAPEAPVREAAPPPQAAVPAPEPEAPAEPPEATLAPAFDPEAPLGLEGPAPAARGAERPRARAAAVPRAAPAPWSGEAAELRRRYEDELRAAVVRARSYPRLARERGLEGSVRLHLIVTRDGRLLAAQLVRSSGAQTLDRAGLAAARDAELPAAPPELPNERFSLEVELVFAGSDR
jgi:protein TonB